MQPEFFLSRPRRFFRLGLQLVGLLLLALLLSGAAAAPAWAEPVEVLFFHSVNCPHCREQMPLMLDLAAYNEDVAVQIYEVSEHPDLWAEFQTKRGLPSGAVPRTAVGDITFIGYSPNDGPLEYSQQHVGYIGYRNQIIQAIERELGHPVNLHAQVVTRSSSPPWWLLGFPVVYLGSGVVLRQRLRDPQSKRYWFGGLAAVGLISAFGFISLTPDVAVKAFAQSLPFPLFVSTIALADGFNPCAFTVLIILLSLLTYTRHRKHMALVGGTFIVTSAVMYFLFIMGMIGVGSVLLAQFGQMFLMALGSAIALAGLINLKDYLWFKQGVTLSLSKHQQTTITRRASKIVRDLQSPQADRLKFMTALGGTIGLAIFVNLVELGCTAILPAVYMTTLVNYCDARGLAPWLCYGGWTAVYAAIYILPLMLILANFIYSFHSARLTETQGRRLKLVAGLFMVFFGLVMVLRPELLILA